ncbi:methyl-accepting chemotaxis protein [Clostridium magnum]|uniref:Methyl-accepting chemotaxis protein McpC n=1 Tax=Clostridium magnum DSM 2767 TaxID=1121326 RepID=A0A162SUQ5_9CLOT|nr:methyl-accepting chemotaxis protein [Clostridium magnum]KZL91893.1 methyl-accepting chemotaxis protein McpC [Clostridium magnum DSM 2767]SHI25314.1 Methyl-accepting chemotaxis protein (MCP) signalling domain-containing protein [Clostridium magnum DSM 2767]
MEVVNNLQSVVIENNKVAEKVGMKVSELGAKSEKISMITQTIRGITSQVNLLSLNASIEAARAGEAGKGFAVVAAEIKKLADDTAKSTVEIENIVCEFKEIILGTNKEMIVAKEVINATSRMSKETGIAFSSIDTAVSTIIKKIDMLVDGINRINKNKQETTRAIEDISAVSEQSASTTEEIYPLRYKNRPLV